MLEQNMLDSNLANPDGLLDIRELKRYCVTW